MNNIADYLEILCKSQRMLSLHLQESKNKEYVIELNAYAIERESQEHNDAQ